MVGLLTFWLPAGFVLVAALAFAAGWSLHKRKERQHERAVEASAQEFVLAAGRARDRARAELEVLKSRQKTLRREHRQLTKDIKTLTGTGSTTKTRKQLDPVKQAAPAGATKAGSRPRRTNRAKPSEPREIAEFAKIEPGPSRPASADQPASERQPAKRSSGAPAFALPKPEGRKDDLTAIHGIGPGLEKALNALGVFHYSQLAGMTGAEIDWLGHRLGSFPGRIRKDRWAEQARRLFASSPAKSAKPARRKGPGKAKKADGIRA